MIVSNIWKDVRKSSGNSFFLAVPCLSSLSQHASSVQDVFHKCITIVVVFYSIIVFILDFTLFLQ